MADETTLKENENEIGGESKSDAIPVNFDLKTIVGWVSKVYIMGYNEYHLREDIAKEFGITADSIKPYISAGQQYKLLEIKHGKGYKATPLFTEIHLPDDDAKKADASIKSLRSPKVFANLFSEYESHILPDVEGISNKLIKSYGFNKPVADRTAKSFYSNIREYNLLGDRNILKNSNHKNEHHVNAPSPADGVPKKEDIKHLSAHDSGTNEGDEVIKLEIKLKGQRFANLTFPKNFEDADLRKMYTVITAYLNAYSESGDVTTANK